VDEPEYGRRNGSGDIFRDAIASGRAKTDAWSGTNFQLIVRTTGGTPILIHNAGFSVSCNQNGVFDVSYQIDPGQFDLVGGANWALSYNGIARC
jgi:hypothetical protein